MSGLAADAARVALTAVLVASGTLKLYDGAARQVPALLGFGLPGDLVRRFWWALPVAEVGIAVSLVVWWSGPAPAWVAVAVLSVFTAALVRALARPERPPCPCFGARSAAPVSARSLVRNGVLLALAVLATG